MKTLKEELIGYQLKISLHEFSELRDNSNKEYVAGYLMGRLRPLWIADKEKKGEGKR